MEVHVVGRYYDLLNNNNDIKTLKQANLCV